MPGTRLLAFLWFAGLAVYVTGCSPAEQPKAEAPSRSESAAGDIGGPEPGVGERGVVLVLGNSLAAGYGLDPELAFPAILQRKIDSLGWGWRVINAGLSGETTAGGLRRADWLLRQRVDVLLLELGGNDGLRGISPETSRANLQGIIDLARDRNPSVRIVLAGMQVPPNLGGPYTRAFGRIFPELAEANDATLIPFLLEGVGGVPQLNLPDGIHPTAAGHEIVADNVWAVLKPVLAAITEPV